ncbi:glycoside hydrolase family 88 protein [Xanthocytophaga flava]|uniref:glycoside hydrolase family 88 protein n=1 Tax=Xanthocytophaga flava TaxID=3048013 RepID=UPI0028D43ECC|nr:DUF4350 domain-containing protein [Xanthocytophaga flavus]MDJ1468706.1 glycoside hydrolase family 88 protein [Xanthocytophaga flavus]
MKKQLLLCYCMLGLFVSAIAQTPTWSERMTASIMDANKDSISYPGGRANWNYEEGLFLKAVERVWFRTGDAAYYRYIKKIIDGFVHEDGSIRTYKMDEYNSDHITPGRSLLMLYQQTGQEKYKLAAQVLRQQLKNQPRTKEGGFWHKKRYPYQMWLDGLYMAEPFYAEYSILFDEPDNFNDIINQFVWMEQNARDEKTGLLYHGWDESRGQKWADPATGKSPNFWSRAMGWYAMALVDVLDYIPANHPRRKELIPILDRLMTAVIKYQDSKEGGWYQVTDKLTGKGNYMEASGSCMFVYALAKGVRMGYLKDSFMVNARKGYEGILKNFISTDDKGMIHLEKTVSVSGLGGDPYRDGSYEYYLSERIRKDDLKGVGPFIMASIEMEIAPDLSVGKGKTVALDYYFNNEYRKTKEGKTERFHYTWDDPKDSGYSLWGNIFREYGSQTVAIPDAPSVANLKNVDVYIIVDPDTPKETANPNYIQPSHVNTISSWVKNGGTLVLLANDTANVEWKHFNTLTKAFGIEFTGKSRNMVKNDVFEQGKFDIPANHPIFKDPKKIFVKELLTLSVKAPAKSILSEGGDVVMAVANVGKGKVFVLGDPWIYNEYLNGKRLPMEYENFKAAKNLSAWLLSGNSSIAKK